MDATGWEELIGPVHAVDDALLDFLGVTREGFEARVDSGDVLVLTALDGGRCAPAFQFTAQAGVIPGLSRVLHALRTTMSDRWGNALWLTAPAKRFGGATAVRMLLTGNADRVVKAAEQDAALGS